MPRARDSQFPVLTHLKELAQEADQFVADFPAESAVDAWFDAVKETFIKIRDCTEITVFEHPSLQSFIFGQERANRNANKVSENSVAHIHAKRNSPASRGNNTLVEEKSKIKVDFKDPHNSSLDCNNKIKAVQNEDEVDQKNSQTDIPSSSIKALHSETAYSPKAKTPRSSKKKTPRSSKKKTPRSSKNKTPRTSKAKTKLAYKANMPHTPNAKTPYTPNAKTIHTAKAKAPYTPKGFMALKTSLLQNCYNNSSEKLTPVMDRTFVRNINASLVLLSSQSGNSDNSSKGAENYSEIKTRSSLKRKSSVNKEDSSKRQKTKVPKDIPAGKTIYPKWTAEKLPLTKNITVGSENKSKLPVVVPTMQIKHTPVISKEKQILEEIKKKEEKAIENRKRVLEERKIKAEENKKRREEKMEKTALKRLKLEKEKEEKREIETKKSQVMKEVVKKTEKKTRVKELIDQSAKESKSGPLSSKQNEMNGDVFKTPASNKSFDSENYELTPVPDSSTYDFSDGEDDRPAGKHIPLWAKGAYFKSALIQQFYNPLDADEIFGQVVDPPDLTEIFCVQKKRYKIRTSSAIWNTPPDRSLRH